MSRAACKQRHAIGRLLAALERDLQGYARGPRCAHRVVGPYARPDAPQGRLGHAKRIERVLLGHIPH